MRKSEVTVFGWGGSVVAVLHLGSEDCPSLWPDVHGRRHGVLHASL